MDGYKGFYKTENELIVKDMFGAYRTVNEIYTISENSKLKYGKEGYGFHFADSISKTMPYFSNAIKEDKYRVGKIQTFGEIVKSNDETGCYVTRSYEIDKILTHKDILNEIINNIDNMESVRILGYYLTQLNDEEKKSILDSYYRLFEKYSLNFDENWLSIYGLYKGILYLKSSLKYSVDYNEYFNPNDKKEYTKSILKEIYYLI